MWAGKVVTYSGIIWNRIYVVFIDKTLIYKVPKGVYGSDDVF